MESSHLNVFIPYPDKPLSHEDQLTRAFLILVRSVKQVEALLLAVLRRHMTAAGIDNVPDELDEAPGGLESVETQVWSTTKERLTGETGRLVSVVITDERLEAEHRVERTPRVAVYDGFVKFKPDWVFVIENKPDHRNVWLEQLSSAFNENYEIEPNPVMLTWSEIIKRLGMLATNGLLQDAGTSLVDDFLAYVSAYFPGLNPYDRFRLCNANKDLLERRCVAIMSEAGLGPVEYHRGWHHSIRLVGKDGIKEVALYPEVESTGTWEIRLDLHPADTMSQARALYSSIDAERVRQLKAAAWSVLPNFHLAYRSSNLYGAMTTLSTEEYIEYWKMEVKTERLRQIARPEWESSFGKWLRGKIISQGDLEKIEAAIVPTKIPTLNVCPGLSLGYRWSGEQAVALDDMKAFVSEVKAKIDEATGIW